MEKVQSVEEIRRLPNEQAEAQEKCVKAPVELTDEQIVEQKEAIRKMLANTECTTRVEVHKQPYCSSEGTLWGIAWPIEIGWRTYFGFDERQRRLIENCQIYAQNDPAGMPGHNLAIIISRFADLLDGDGAKSRKLEDQ